MVPYIVLTNKWKNKSQKQSKDTGGQDTNVLEKEVLPVEFEKLE